MEAVKIERESLGAKEIKNSFLYRFLAANNRNLIRDYSSSEKTMAWQTLQQSSTMAYRQHLNIHKKLV